MIISFTGHRDCVTTPEQLEWIWNTFRRDEWRHGGARGFDTQIDNLAKSRGKTCQVFRPDYERFSPRYAPIQRNHVHLVEPCDILVACWDYRRTGGTFDTIKYAEELGKVIQFVPAISTRGGW